MRITIDNVELAGDATEKPSGLEGASEFADQVAQISRGKEPLFFDRGNRSVPLSFTVRRKHESVDAAQAFCINHLDEATRVGTITFAFGSGAGGTTRYARGRVKIKSFRHVGVTTFHTYDLVCGRITKEKPT